MLNLQKIQFKQKFNNLNCYMKFLKIISILLFCTIIVLPVFSQDRGNMDAGLNPVSEEVGEKSVSDDVHLSEEKKEPDLSPENEDVKITEPKKVEVKKEPAKSPVVKKSVIESGKTAQKKTVDEPEFLRIDEGSFKYSRIPELAVSEVKAQVVISPEIENPDDSGAADLSDGDSEKAGILGMKKETADIVAKVGILLLIFVVFILYKSRMKGTGKSKKGPGRNVLNSYRK